jgi:hypothetical protein
VIELKKEVETDPTVLLFRRWADQHWDDEEPLDVEAIAPLSLRSYSEDENEVFCSEIEE